MYEITKEDVGATLIKKPCCSECGGKKNLFVGDLMGHIQAGDIGKRIYEINGLLYVENNEQRDLRIKMEN